MLLAESISIDLGTLLSILGPVVAIAGTVAVMKWRQGQLEEQQKESKVSSKEDKEKLERVDEKIFDEIRNLGKTMQRQFREQNDKQAEAEKSMIGKIDNFQSKVFHRLDDVQTQLADHDKRLSLAEADAQHTKEKVEKHAQKITLFGKKPFVPPDGK